MNLSTDNPVDADRLAELGSAPVVTIVANAYARRKQTETMTEWRDRIASLPVTTPGGRRLAICPATFTDTTCDTCGTCARPREVIVAFPAHGARWRQVEAVTGIIGQDVPGQLRMAEVTAGERCSSS